MDLPGYGYARTSKVERAKWAQLIESYIKGNTWLKAVAVLLDSRLPPQKIDMELVSFLRGSGIPVIPVLTKTDKTKQRDREKVRKQWAPMLDGRKPVVTSAQTGAGVDQLWQTLREAVGAAQDE